MASPPRGTPAGGTMLRPTFAYGNLPARDIERARRFYADALGVHPFAERGGHLYYDVGGCRFMVFTSTGSAPGSHDQLGFAHRRPGRPRRPEAGQGVVFEDFPGTSDGIADLGPIDAVTGSG